MDKWTREETIIAFNLYCKIPFKSSSKTHPLVVKYAQIIGRSAGALNMKIRNIGRLDPDLKSKGITGLTHGGKVEQEVWNEFYGNPELLAYESERLIAKFSGKSFEETTHIQIDDLPEGNEREVVVRQRVNQSFFRATVMNAYNFQCCISGVKKSELVEACHIVDWAEDVANRTNQKNGLCLNPFFHKAYDKLLISITPDFELWCQTNCCKALKVKPLTITYRKWRAHRYISQTSSFPRENFLKYTTINTYLSYERSFYESADGWSEC